MDREQRDAQAAADEHHHDVGDTRGVRQQLGVSRPGMAGGAQAFLVERRRHQGVHPPRHRVAGRAQDRLGGGGAAGRRGAAPRDRRLERDVLDLDVERGERPQAEAPGALVDGGLRAVDDPPRGGAARARRAPAARSPVRCRRDRPPSARRASPCVRRAKIHRLHSGPAAAKPPHPRGEHPHEHDDARPLRSWSPRRSPSSRSASSDVDLASFTRDEPQFLAAAREQPRTGHWLAGEPALRQPGPALRPGRLLVLRRRLCASSATTRAARSWPWARS